MVVDGLEASWGWGVGHGTSINLVLFFNGRLSGVEDWGVLNNNWLLDWLWGNDDWLLESSFESTDLLVFFLASDLLHFLLSVGKFSNKVEVSEEDNRSKNVSNDAAAFLVVSSTVVLSTMFFTVTVALSLVVLFGFFVIGLNSWSSVVVLSTFGSMLSSSVMLLHLMHPFFEDRWWGLFLIIFLKGLLLDCTASGILALLIHIVKTSTSSTSW